MLEKLQNVGEYGKLITEDGRIKCPSCGRPTQQRVRPDTSGENWPIWCKHCKREHIVNIDKRLSQCRVTTSA